MSSYNTILLLGSNIGNKKNNLETAIALIGKHIGKIQKKSDFLTSEPVEFVSSNNFCNIALSIITAFSPFIVLKLVKKIEMDMGRSKDSLTLGGYHDRIIDIDIVEFENLRFISKKLQIPHYKHKYEREFSRKLLQDL